MTTAEKLAEMRDLYGPLEVPFSLVHQRFEKLMGRPVWTHELASPDSLYAELCSGQRATFSEIVGKLPGDNIIILTRDSEAANG